MTTTQLKTTAALIARLATLETVARHAKDTDQLAAEWRAVSAELNRRPLAEVLAA